MRFGKNGVYHGMPYVEIIAKERVYNFKKEKTETKEVTRYLYAFRNYCFQVCGNYEGETDKGSTPVFGLDSFKSVKQYGMSNLSDTQTSKYFIAAIAYDAIVRYIYRCADGESVLPFQIGKYCSCEFVTFDGFVDDCYKKYVLGETLKDSNDFEEEAM